MATLTPEQTQRHPHLTALRVRLALTAAQMKRVDGLFKPQVQVVQLLAADGLPEPSLLAASQFLLKHRAALEDCLSENRDETVDMLKALILELATSPPEDLRVRVRGVASVVGEGLALPIRNLGVAKIKGEIRRLMQQVNLSKLLKDVYLIHDGKEVTAELRFWGQSHELPTAKTSYRPPKSGQRSASNKTKAPSERSAQMGAAPVISAALQALPLTRKRRKALENGSLARNTATDGVTITRRSVQGNSLSPYAAVGARMPAQNFPSSAIQEKTETIDCTCHGDNANCFRCDGRGFYERVASAFSKPVPVATGRSAEIVKYESDGRGGSYAVRESGRFLSNAEHDDFGDESVA